MLTHLLAMGESDTPIFSRFTCIYKPEYTLSYWRKSGEVN